MAGFGPEPQEPQYLVVTGPEICYAQMMVRSSDDQRFAGWGNACDRDHFHTGRLRCGSKIRGGCLTMSFDYWKGLTHEIAR